MQNEHSYSKNNLCVDCKKLICNVSIRCKTCSNKSRDYVHKKTGKATKLQGFAYLKINDVDKFNLMRRRSSKIAKKLWLNPKYRQKMIEIHKSMPPSMLGKKHSEETKKKMKIHKNSKEFKTLIRLANSRERSHLWAGGISFEPYTCDFNKQFKELIRERDTRTCQLCNLFENDSLRLYGKNLYVHHIDYNKKNSFPQNCITLCVRCNALVNKNREIWTKHFQELLKKLYNYQYTQDQKIILDFIQNEEK